MPKDSSNSYGINVHDGLVHKIEKGPWKGRFGERISRTQRLREAVKCATDLHSLGSKKAGKLEALGSNGLGGKIQSWTQS